jgi:hypothetical protein
VYYVGPAVDPAHPHLLTTGGDVVIREQPERWNVTGRAKPSAAWSAYGPITSRPSSAFHPDPVAADYAQKLAQATKIVSLLGARAEQLEEENKKLKKAPSPNVTAQPAAGPIIAAVGGSSEAVTVTNQTTSTQAEQNPDLITLLPNSEGVIDMRLAVGNSIAGGSSNPFASRWTTKTTAQNLSLRISSLAIGSPSSITLNGKLISVGDSYEGFRLHTVDRDGVYLQRDGFLLRVPMGEAPVQVRLP